MNKKRFSEVSAGAIIVNSEGLFLIVKTNGNWGFPKGHIEPGETEKEAALREVKEETGLDVILHEKKHEITYFLRDNKKERKIKKVIFYFAEAVNANVTANHEIEGYEWLSREDAMKKLTFKEAKEAFKALTG